MPSLSQSPSVCAQSSDKPWLAHYPICVPKTLEYPESPVWALLEQAARYHSERTACIYYEQRLTYAELHRAARRAAAMFVRLGVRPGDRVGLLLPNVPEYLIAAFGAWMAGAVVVPLSPLSVAEEIDALLSATDCRVVVGLDLLAPLVMGGSYRPRHLLLVSIQDRIPLWKRLPYGLIRMQRVSLPALWYSGRICSFARELAASDENFAAISVPQDSPAYILATGGTTGAPKAVVLTHRNLVSNAWQLLHWSGCRIEKDTFLCVLPFFHSYGLTSCALTGIASAATLVLYQKFDAKVVLGLIERHRPTVFHAVPAILSMLNAALREHPRDLRSIQVCISGGAPLDPAIAKEFSRHCDARLVEGYGLSEASPVTHVGPLDGSDRPGTIGLPLPDTEARIVDAETGLETLHPGVVGELVIRGPQVMQGYWNDPEATARTIRNGWLHTGDLAICDDDGFFRIVDRKKDLIITSGFNVYPTEVESMLRRYPGIADVAVVGVPDAQRGEIVKALVVPAKETPFDVKAFQHFASLHLAKHKQPRLIEVLDTDLPRNFLGKVLRRKLRDGQSSESVVTPLPDVTTADTCSTPTKTIEFEVAHTLETIVGENGIKPLLGAPVTET